MIFSKDFQWISRSKASILNQSSPKAKNLSAFSVRFVFGFLICIVLLVCCSCGTSRKSINYEPLTINRTDTLYLNKVQYDSIYVNSAHNMDYRRDQRWDSIVVWNEEIHKLHPEPSRRAYTIHHKPLVDTMYIHDKNVEYKYKFLHDTCYVHQVDTIPVIQQVEVVKTEKYIPWYSKVLSWIGVISLLLVVIYLVVKLVFKR